MSIEREVVPIMKVYVSFVILAIFLGGCEPPPEPQKSVVLQTPGNESTPRTNIGDLEAYITIEGILSAEFERPNVFREESRNRMKKLIKYSIRCRAPYPDYLPVNFNVVTNKKFPDSVVVIRVKVISNGEELVQFAMVLGRDSEADIQGMTVDLLSGYDEPPDRIVAHGQAEVVLLPLDTDIDSIDINTVTAGPADMTTILGSLVTVTFEEAL